MPFSLRQPWTRFWHVPVRAERLAITRIFLALALVTDQLIHFLPHMPEFFGPEGQAPAGTHDDWMLRVWRWTVLLFNTDNLTIVYTFFWFWMAVTVAFLFGWHTRLMGVLVWFTTLCFLNRNPSLVNLGDDILMFGLFMLMISPCGRALSLDASRTQKSLGASSTSVVPLTSAWPVRIFQIQLCVIYLCTALAKLVCEDDFFEGSWWDGTSIHYVLNNIALSRWSYAQHPLPLWLTAAVTYVSVWWEALFLPLVLVRWTRKWTLWFGVLFHLGIFLTIEVGWFSFYTLSLYGVWIPGEFWDRFRRRPGPVPAVATEESA